MINQVGFFFGFWLEGLKGEVGARWLPAEWDVVEEDSQMKIRVK